MVDTKPVWEVLLGISAGSILAWAAVICGIVSGIVAGTIKLYKAFSKVKDLKDANAEKTETLQKHEETMAQICEQLSRIKDSLDEQQDVNLKQVRYQIVHTCDDALAAGYITAGKLRSMEELFEEYTNIFHANGYVKVLVEKVRQLEVRGRLDD